MPLVFGDAVGMAGAIKLAFSECWALLARRETPVSHHLV